jgi:AAHS family 4-hydroxybenzoate transporter-like MFS transporter
MEHKRAEIPVRYAVPVVGFLVAMVDGYDTLMLAFIAPLISKEWALLPHTVGQLFSSSYAGAALGATVIGMAADRFGRKTLLLASLTLAGIFTMLCAWATSPLQLMLLRAVAGLGLGGALPTVTALIAAYASPVQRSATVTRMFLGFPVGAIVGGALTTAAMSNLGWRGVFLGGGTCALLLVPLVSIGLKETGTDNGLEASRVHSRHPLVELIADHRGLSTVLFCLSVFLMLLTSYFLVSWTPTVMTLNGATPQHAALSAVVLNCGGIAGTLILSFAFGHASPLPTVAGSLCVGAILIALLGQGTALAGATAFLWVFPVGLLIIGAQGGIAALCTHLYPVPVHATAVGLSVAIGRLGSILGPLAGGYLVSARLGWNRLFLFASLPAFTAAIAMAALAATRTRLGERP